METVTYFAYGSNLDPVQMRRRCPGARLLGPATLRGHRLAFAGHSCAWGGAVATMVRQRGAAIEGVLYRVPRAELAVLDRCEGHPFLYERRRVTVLAAGGRRLAACAYVLRTNAAEAPSPPCYARVLQRAYRRHGFDRQALAVASGGVR